jgi:hypothetical protein
MNANPGCHAVCRNAVSLFLIGAVNSLIFAAPSLAQSPSCQQIRATCKDAGFVQGGRVGNRLVKDCIDPIVYGAQQPGMASKPLPIIAPQLVAVCRSDLSGAQSSPEAAAAGLDAISTTPSAAAARSQPLSKESSGLIALDGGQTVFDSRLNVTWLADANLAAKQSFGVPGINKTGSMDYATAIRWVIAMNEFDHGAGYLGHNNWQLPTTPAVDASCARTGRHGESFGFNCSGSALGSLYYVSFGLREPDSAIQALMNRVGPFRNFQPYLYWSKSPAADPKQGFVSFSFNTGFQGANVWRNHLYVLPMIKGKLPTSRTNADEKLELDPGGQTVYDAIARVTWLADANLASQQSFGIAGIDRDGSMDHATAVQWVNSMNKADGGRGYLGQTGWDLPETGPPDPSCSLKGTTGFSCAGSAMGTLFYRQLRLRPGESIVAPVETHVGPFYDLQPYLYWSCEAESVRSACQSNGPAARFEWNFSFGNGFEGTNLVGNDLYVMVYYPQSTAVQPAPKPP